MDGITVDTTLSNIFDRKKSNSFLSLNRFQKPPISAPTLNKPPELTSCNRIFSGGKPPLPRKVENLQAYDRDNFAIPRAKSEGSVTCCQGDVVMRRRSSTQTTAEIIERRNNRLSRVSINSAVYDMAYGSRRSSIASCEYAPWSLRAGLFVGVTTVIVVLLWW
jgi:hypothetical protein